MLLTLLVALAPLTRGARAEDATLVPGNVVGRLEVEAPASARFVLRGTLPLPRNVYPRADGLSPFAVRDSTGAIVLAQSEIVSRHSAPGLGADVVEILARVHRPDVPLGTRLRYDVVYQPHASTGGLTPDPRVSDLVREQRSVILATRDVFGNLYTANLAQGNAGARILRDGDTCVEWRTYSNLVPVTPHGGPSATLPHMMGVHAYFRIYDQEPVVSLDLRIHNGHSGLDPTTPIDDPIGRAYFDEIALYVPSEWNVVLADRDAFSAATQINGSWTKLTLVRRLAHGDLHTMPIQAQFVRRMTLVPRGLEDKGADYALDRNLGFSRRGNNAAGEHLFSWWNPSTGHYFPQRHVLPRLDHVSLEVMRANLADKAEYASNALRTGAAPGYPILAPAYGWAHPWGIDDGGMAGGDEVTMFEGIEVLEAASNAGWRWLAMRSRMLTERQPVALFDKDGEPSDYSAWTLHGFSGEWLPIWCFLRPILWAADPFGFLDAPMFQVNAVATQGRKPYYEVDLDYYKPIDLEHLVRYTAPAKALVWIGNDTLSKEALMLHAACFRMSYNELPNSDYGHFISTGLGNDMNYVARRPNFGFVFGRLEGWGLDCLNAAYSIGSPEYRTFVKPWFDKVIDTVQHGQAECSGIIQAMVYEQLFGGNYRARQSIEQAIVENALVGTRESVMDGRDPVRSARIDHVLQKSFRAMVTYPSWSDEYHAPWSKLAVGDNDFDHVPFCSSVPSDGTADGGDIWQCWSSFGYAYELTGNPFFFTRASEMAGGPILARLLADGTHNLNNKAALLALLQNLP